MESYEDDRAHMHALIGLPYKGELHYLDMKEIHGSELTTADWTKLLFTNVTEETKQKLREILKYDFEIYDYDPFLY